MKHEEQKPVHDASGCVSASPPPAGGGKGPGAGHSAHRAGLRCELNAGLFLSCVFATTTSRRCKTVLGDAVLTSRMPHPGATSASSSGSPCLCRRAGLPELSAGALSAHTAVQPGRAGGRGAGVLSRAGRQHPRPGRGSGPEECPAVLTLFTPVEPCSRADVCPRK